MFSAYLQWGSVTAATAVAEWTDSNRTGRSSVAGLVVAVVVLVIVAVAVVEACFVLRGPFRCSS